MFLSMQSDDYQNPSPNFIGPALPSHVLNMHDIAGNKWLEAQTCIDFSGYLLAGKRPEAQTTHTKCSLPDRVCPGGDWLWQDGTANVGRAGNRFLLTAKTLARSGQTRYWIERVFIGQSIVYVFQRPDN